MRKVYLNTLIIITVLSNLCGHSMMVKACHLGPRMLQAYPDKQLNSYTNGNQGAPTVAVLADQKFVVAYDDDTREGSLGIYGKVFNFNGTDFSSEFHANQHTTDKQHYPKLAVLIREGAFSIFIPSTLTETAWVEAN